MRLATSTPSADRSVLLRGLGLVLALCPVFVRASTGISPFPGWELDPLVFSLPSDGLGPTLQLVLDAVACLGCVLLLVDMTLRGARMHAALWLLGVLGAVGVVLHGGVLEGSIGLESRRIGSAWVTSIVLLLTMLHAARDAHVRRLALGLGLGFALVLLLRGLHQVYVQHPTTMADFNADRARFLAAHGWVEGSPMAKAFVRRLSQPEASGWFGLANVYATFAAWACVAGTMLTCTVLARRRRGDLGGSGVDALAASAVFIAGAAGLSLAGAKGGYLATAGGLVALVLFAWLNRQRPWSATFLGVVGVISILGPLALVAARGLVGERIGELSLWFRWFYWQAAGRMFVEHPLVGVGPAGFQSAYLLAKPPISPEDVSSPHAIVMDWVATLGMFGLCWCGLLLACAWRIGRSGVSTRSDERNDESEMPRALWRAAFGVVAITVIGASFVESGVTTPDLAILRLAGLIAWAGGTYIVVRMLQAHAGIERAALAGAGLTLLAHAQIDVTASFASSAPLWAMLIGLAASDRDSFSPTSMTTSPARSRKMWTWFACSVAGGASILAAAWAIPASAWEQRLEDAAATVRPLGVMSERLTRLSRPEPAHTGLPSDSPTAVATDLGQLVRRHVDPTPAAISQAMFDLERTRCAEAARLLNDAFAIDPSDRRPLREASRLFLRLSEVERQAGRHSAAKNAIIDGLRSTGLVNNTPSGVGLTAQTPTLGRAKSTDWHWLGVAATHAADVAATIGGTPDEVRGYLSLAVQARTRCQDLDPYNLDNAWALARLYERLGDMAQARAWAATSLGLDANMRLDREVRGLSDEDRVACEALAKQDASGPGK